MHVFVVREQLSKDIQLVPRTSLTFIVDLALNIHKALKLELAACARHGHVVLLGFRILICLELSISVTDSFEFLARAPLSLRLLQVTIPRLQRMRGRLAELVANDAVDGRLRSVGLAVREVVAGQRSSAPDLLPQGGGMISDSSVMFQPELGAHDGVRDTLDNLFLVELLEVAGR